MVVVELHIFISVVIIVLLIILSALKLSKKLFWELYSIFNILQI